MGVTAGGMVDTYYVLPEYRTEEAQDNFAGQFFSLSGALYYGSGHKDQLIGSLIEFDC